MNNYLSKIPFQWKYTQGKGTKVGIIDAGFDVNNIYLKKHIACFKDFGHTNIKHGTHVMGIMCLQTTNVSVVKGYAPRSQYYLASVPIGQEEDSPQKLIDALQWMMQFNIDVLNMSFTCLYQKKQFKDLLYQLYLKNAIIVSSFSKDYLYPHIYDFIIGAGSDLIVNSEYLSSVQNNKFDTIGGTSMQSAFISSVCAIAKSYDKKINKDRFMKIVSGNKIVKELNYDKLNQISIKL